MRLLVCGGRDFVDREWMFSVLDKLAPTVVIHGAAPGADTLADEWAKARGVPREPYPAEWWKYKNRKAAGPIRNSRMLREGKPDAVLAFPGNDGTADMTRKAKRAGVPVIEAERADAYVLLPDGKRDAKEFLNALRKPCADRDRYDLISGELGTYDT